MFPKIVGYGGFQSYGDLAYPTMKPTNKPITPIPTEKPTPINKPKQTPRPTWRPTPTPTSKPTYRQTLAPIIVFTPSPVSNTGNCDIYDCEFTTLIYYESLTNGF